MSVQQSTMCEQNNGIRSSVYRTDHSSTCQDLTLRSFKFLDCVQLHCNVQWREAWAEPINSKHRTEGEQLAKMTFSIKKL